MAQIQSKKPGLTFTNIDGDHSSEKAPQNGILVNKIVLRFFLILFVFTAHTKQAEIDICTEPYNVSHWNELFKHCMFDNNWVG